MKVIKRITTFKGDFSFLSNFSPHGFWFKNIWFQTNEHFYCANKTNSLDWFTKIVEASTPGKAKRLGRQAPLRPDWSVARIPVMRKGVFAKFQQNDKILELLKQTNGMELIEGNNWHDNVWGKCFCPKCKNIAGLNILGQLLMEVREVFVDNKSIKN